MEFLWFLIIGIAAGWIAGQIMKGSGFGIIMNLVIGVVGAFIGGFIFRFFGVGGDGILFSLFASVVGAVVLLWIIGLVKKK